jgi:hypothetical protein
MLEKGVSGTTVEFKISLVRAIRSGPRARSSTSRRVGTAEGHITDAKG